MIIIHGAWITWIFTGTCRWHLGGLLQKVAGVALRRRLLGGGMGKICVKLFG